MQTLDITIDLETCSLQPTAAIMQIAAVAWDREGETLFLEDERGDMEYFSQGIYLVDQVMLGRSFDQNTIDWWSKQKKEAQEAVAIEDRNTLLSSMRDFCYWVDSLKHQYEAKAVCIWSQGTDFDIAILRSVFDQIGEKFPVSHKNIRDARTYIQEVGAVKFGITRDQTAADPNAIYKLLPEEPFEGAVHDAVYDCKRTTFAVKTIMNMQENETSRTLLGTVAANETRTVIEQ